MLSFDASTGLFRHSVRPLEVGWCFFLVAGGCVGSALSGSVTLAERYCGVACSFGCVVVKSEGPRIKY